MIGKELTYGIVTRIIETNIQKFNEFSPSDFKHMLEEVVQNQPNTSNITTNMTELLQQVLQNQNTILQRLSQIEQKISDKTLKKALNENIPYQGHYYRMLGPKISTGSPTILSL